MKKLLLIFLGIVLFSSLVSGALTDNLLHYYSFTTNADDDHGALNGTVDGATHNAASGPIAGYYEFDGDNDKITLSGNVLGGETAASVQAWFNMSAAEDLARGGVSSFDNGNRNWRLNPHQEVGHSPFFGVWIGNSQYYAMDSNNDISDDTWHHLVGVYNGTHVAIWLDGVDVSDSHTAASGAIDDEAADTTFGTEDDVPYWFDGGIAEVGIWNRSLTEAEIVELYNSGAGLAYPFAPPPPPPEPSISLVGYWKLNCNANDSSGTGNHGTVLLGTTCTNKGRFKQAYDFDGVDDYIYIPPSDSLNLSGSFTLEVWFKGTHALQNYSNPSGSDVKLLWRQDDAPEISLRTSQTIKATMRNTTPSGWYPIYSVNTWNDGEWNYVVATYNITSGNFSLYLNGEYEASRIVTNGNAGAVSNYFRIGRDDAGRWFKGLIDEVKIYNGSLTADEVRESYNESLKSHSLKVYGNSSLKVYGSADKGLLNESGLVGLWHLDGNANDSSGQGNDGILFESNFTNKGRFKQAFEFRDSYKAIQVPFDSTLNLTNFTYSTWYNPGASLVTQNIYKINAIDTNYTVGTEVNHLGIDVVHAVPSDGEGFIFRENITLPKANEWYHVYANSVVNETLAVNILRIQVINLDDNSVLLNVTRDADDYTTTSYSHGGTWKTVLCPTTNIQLRIVYLNSSGLELWTRYGGITHYDTFFYKKNVINLRLFNGRERLTIYNSSGSTFNFYAKQYTDANIRNWHHYALTVNGTSVNQYHNGVLSDTDTLPGGIKTSSYPIYIGGISYSNYERWDGLIDETRMYNRPLSASEIRELYNETKISYSEKVYGSADAIFN